MLITKLAGESVALGLQWRLMDSVDERDEASKIAKQEGRSYGVIARAGINNAVGLAEKNENAISAAQWLASSSKSADIVLVEPLDEGQYWICGVKDGMPLATFDVVGDADLAAVKVRELTEATQGSLKVYAPEGMFPEAMQKPFADHVREIGKPPRIHKITKSYSAIAIGLLLLIAAGVGGYVWTEAQRSLKRQQSLAEQARRASQDILGEKQRVIDKQKADYAAAMEQMNRDIATPRPSDLVNSWVHAMDAVSVAEAGWLAIAAECTQASCTVSFQRDTFGTMLTFAAWSATQPWARDTKVDADLAMVAIPVSAARPRQQIVEGLPAWESVKPALYSRLQEVVPAGPRFSFEKPGDPQVFYARKPGEKEDLAPPMRLPAAFSKWQLKGRYLHEPTEMATLIEEPNMIVDNLSIRFSKTSIDWTLEGRYVSKK